MGKQKRGGGGKVAPLLCYQESKITMNGNYRGVKGWKRRSTYDDSVGGDVQGSCSEDRGGGRATPSTGLLVGRVWNREKNICDLASGVILPFPALGDDQNGRHSLNYRISYFVFEADGGNWMGKSYWPSNLGAFWDFASLLIVNLVFKHSNNYQRASKGGNFIPFWREDLTEKSTNRALYFPLLTSVIS